MNEGKSSIHDVLGQLKVERPDCSYVRMNRTREIVRTPIDTRENYQQTQMVNSYSTFTNTNGEQKSEIVKRILRQCPEDDGMVRSFEIFSNVLWSIITLFRHRWRCTKRVLHRKEENNKVKIRSDSKTILVEFRMILSDTHLKWTGCLEVSLGVCFLDIHAIVKITLCILDPMTKRRSFLRDLHRITFREENMKAVVETGRKPVIPKVCNLFFVKKSD